MIKLLLDCGAQVNSQDNVGWSSLMLTSSNGDSEVVKLLLDSGAQVDLQNNVGRSYLRVASSNGDSDVGN